MVTKSGGKYFMWGMLALLFVGLIGFGSGGVSRNVQSVGLVGTKEIPVPQYANALKSQIDAFGAQIGTPLTFQQAQAIGLDQSVLNRMVTERTLDNETDRLGVSVGDARILRQITAIPAFQGLDGKFDPETYRMQLDSNNLNQVDFEASLREDTARGLLQSAIVGGIPEPGAYADAMVRYIGEKRGLTWAPLTALALTAPLAPPTAAALQEYYDAYPEAFTSLEVRHISYAWLTPEMIQDQVTVDDQAVQDLYQERIAEFVQPERRLVERLVFGDDAQANAAKARIDAGEVDFDALVVERGLNLADVDLGDLARDDLGAAGDAVFAATAGDVVGPFLSNLGPALFRMNAVLAAQETTFEAAEPDLRTELANQRARRVIEDASDSIVDLIAGGATLEDLVENTDLELGQIAWSADVTDGIAAYESFRNAAAVVADGSFPELQEFNDGGVFVLRLDSIDPPALRPFADLQDQVVADWTAASTRAAVMTQAETIAAALNDGATFEAQGLTPVVEPGLTRRDFVAETPPTFLTDVFTMEPGQTAVLENGDGAVIVRLDSIVPPDPADPAMVAERASVAATVASGIADDVFAIFSQTLQAQTQVTLNTAALKAVHAQFN